MGEVKRYDAEHTVFDGDEYKTVRSYAVVSEGGPFVLYSDYAALEQELEMAVEALKSIRIYANDTLSGRIDGPDDREWQRAAVIELRDRASAAISAALDGKVVIGGANV